MKLNTALLLLWVTAHTLSCPAQNEVIRPGNVASFPKPTDPVLLRLGDKDGRVQLTCSNGGDQWQAVGGVRLRAFNEILLGIPEHDPSSTKTTPRRPVTLWWLDGHAVETTPTNSLKVFDYQSSNDWEFASLDLTPAFGARVNEFRRHLLYVQPDLVVICDEVSFKEPAAVQTGWWFPGGLAFDSVRDEWRVQLSKAGLTVRAFGSPRGDLKSLESSDAVNANVVLGLKCLQIGVTHKTPEYRLITVLVPHEKDARRSLAFKSLESDTAVGVRVHRDGLPTLIAFRKSTTLGEADLTGLKFSGPVAVDVFRPRRR